MRAYYDDKYLQCTYMYKYINCKQFTGNISYTYLYVTGSFIFCISHKYFKLLTPGKLCTNGRMTVPSHKIDRKLAPWIVEYGNDGVVTRNMLPSERETVKKFMLHYFYQEASVPNKINQIKSSL